MTVHEKPVGGSVEWYTPRSLFRALGADFDLDPAAGQSPHECVPAEWRYDKTDDGLAHEWHGHVWLNPPYGPAGVQFIERMIAHGDGLLLLPSRTETAAYQRCLAAAAAVCLLRDRLWFIRNDGVTGRSSFGSTLFAFGDWAAGVLTRADLGWTSVRASRSRLDDSAVLGDARDRVESGVPERHHGSVAASPEVVMPPVRSRQPEAPSPAGGHSLGER